MGVAERVKKEYPQFDVRVSILGHLQRGGSPYGTRPDLGDSYGCGRDRCLVG